MAFTEIFTTLLFRNAARIKELLDPEDAQDAATKSYVDRSSGSDFHSGYSDIPEDTTVTILAGRQSINFTVLTLDGDLNLEGDLWLA